MSIGQYKTKYQFRIIIPFALCLAVLFALRCIQFDYENPLDPNAGPHYKPPVITFDFNYEDSNLKPVTCTVWTDGKLKDFPQVPQRSEYDFVGWYTVSANIGGTPITADYVFIKNTKVYARWIYTGSGQSHKVFNVKFYENWDEGTILTDVTGADSTLEDLPKPKERSGYTFYGWYTPAYDKGGDTVTILTKFISDTAVYARWEAVETPYDTFEITFDANWDGGSVSPESLTTGADSTLPYLPLPDERSGYTFYGWFTDARDGKGDSVETITKFQKDITIYAHWKIGEPTYKTFTVTFNANHTGGSVSPENLTTGADSTLPYLPEPQERAGYTFIYWYDAVEGGNPVTTDSKFKENTEIYAQWALDEYDITYVIDSDVDNKLNPKKYTILQTPIQLAEPTREGYDFTDWLDNRGTAVKSIPAKSTGDKTFTAGWVPKNFTIEYNLDGGENHEENPSSYTIESGEIIFEDPAKKGYDFAGWFDNRDNLVTSVPAKSTGDKTYTAKWMLKNYDIVYNLDGGENHEDNPSSYTIVSDKIIFEDATKKGYEFTGWVDSRNNPVISIIPSELDSLGDKHLKATWKVISYTIKYNTNGGEFAGGLKAQDTLYTVEKGVKLRTPQKDGHTFAGWYDNSGFAGTKIDSIPADTIGDREYWADWTEDLTSYTIAFEPSGGVVTPIRRNTVNGGLLESLPTPEKPGYYFGGWFTVQKAQDGGDPVTLDRIYSANDTIYARWYASDGSQLNKNHPSINYGLFTDTRDYMTYRTVEIYGKTWMAENLGYMNWPAQIGKCYDGLDENCIKYGALYTWAEAMDVDKKYNNTLLSVSDVNHQGICPDGWHLPSYEEWSELADIVGGASLAGTELKAKTGWHDDGNGQDNYGFSALPGGSGKPFDYVGKNSSWWSATEGNMDRGFGKLMLYNKSSMDGGIADKENMFSVRCVRD